MSELQDLFEQGNPIPKGVTRCGDHYAQTEYMLIDPYASNYAARFKGFMEGVKHQQAIIDEHTEVIKLQDADLRKYEKQIESLKAQLNNMEACYIEKKKECEELQARANKALSVTGNYCDEDDAALLVFVLEKALRGAND